MSRKFAVFDIDGTLIRWQLYHALTDELARSGLIDQKAYQAAITARKNWKQRAHAESFKAYEDKLIVAFDKSLAQISAEDFLLAARHVINEYKDQVYTYTRDLIRELKAQDYLLFAISGSQQEIVAMLAEHFGFDESAGTIYAQAGGRFTGAKQALINKEPALKKMIAKHKVTLSGSLAVGDSGSDIAMLKLVEKPIAFNPDTTLFEQAKSQGWQIVIERKNVIYKLEPKNGRYLLA